MKQRTVRAGCGGDSGAHEGTEAGVDRGENVTELTEPCGPSACALKVPQEFHEFPFRCHTNFPPWALPSLLKLPHECPAPLFNIEQFDIKNEHALWRAGSPFVSEFLWDPNASLFANRHELNGLTPAFEDSV